MEFVGFIPVQRLYWKRDPSWLVPIHKYLCNNQVSSWKMEKVSRYLWKFHRMQMEENMAYLPSTLHLIIVTSRFRILQKQGHEPRHTFNFPVGSRIWFLWNLPVVWNGNCKGSRSKWNGCLFQTHEVWSCRIFPKVWTYTNYQSLPKVQMEAENDGGFGKRSS